MPRYRRKRRGRRRRRRSQYATIKSVVPPEAIKVQLVDYQNERTMTAPGAGEHRSNNGVLLEIKWNSIASADLVCSLVSDLVGYERLHQMYQQYRIPSASLWVEFARKITEGVDTAAAALSQKTGIFVFIYGANDGASLSVATPSWWGNTVSNQGHLDRQIQEMKADPLVKWRYLKPIYNMSTVKGAPKASLAKTENVVKQQKNHTPTYTKANELLNGTLPSHSSGLAAPTTGIYMQYGALMDTYVDFDADIELKIRVIKNVNMFHRQDDVTVH